MKEIPLTQGKVAVVDDADYEWLMQWKWYAYRKPNARTWYARRNTARGRWRQKTLLMHRVIMNSASAMQVDHWDQNGLNNRRDNLRVCTSRDNHYNVKRRADNTSGYKGVSWDKRGRWVAYINYEGKRHHLGYFNSSEEAARAYNNVALAAFQEFAWLNGGIG